MPCTQRILCFVFTFSLHLPLAFRHEASLDRNNPEDESSRDDDQSTVLASFGKDFFFGLATAAAHVEEAVENDPWVDFARKGGVAAYHNTPYSDIRLKFWTEPEVEIDLAANTGVTVFRMGVEWARLVPKHPDEAGLGVQNKTALARYKEICKMVKDRGMKVMLTLFHHSIPEWSEKNDGWKNRDTITHFLSFAEEVATELRDVVDYWVTFNEPHVFVLLVHCAGVWPPGYNVSTVGGLACLSPGGGNGMIPAGAFQIAMANIGQAHREFYAWAHRKSTALDSPQVGVAHNVADFEGASLAARHSTVKISEQLFKKKFVEQIMGHIDYLGLNYYAKEVVSTTGAAFSDDVEYSESGRGIFPDGFLKVIMQFHDEYATRDAWKSSETGLAPPIIITENGIADATDVYRPSYIVEHLLAIREAIRRGANVVGYIHWTISDNWEWADGYCPKFGLVDVDRTTKNLTRTPRPSYYLYSKFARGKQVTVQDRDLAWLKVIGAAKAGTKRPFCRDEDGQTGLDDGWEQPRGFRAVDWRFSQLSQAENGCYHTPWTIQGDIQPRFAPVASTGICEFLQAPNKTTKSSSWMKRLLQWGGKGGKKGKGKKGEKGDASQDGRDLDVFRREKRCPDQEVAVEEGQWGCSGSRANARP